MRLGLCSTALGSPAAATYLYLPGCNGSRVSSTVQKQAAETLEPLNVSAQNASDMACSLDNPDACEACGS